MSLIDSTMPGANNNAKISYKILWLALFIFLLDQLTKFFVAHFLPVIDEVAYVYPYGGVGVFKNFLGIEFSINHMTNKGAAWGVLGNYQLPLIVLRIGLISATLIYLLFFNQQRSWQIPLALIIGGAIGNVFDFFTYGHVIDMLHVVLGSYDFPVFNIADSAISIGIIWLFILSWFKS